MNTEIGREIKKKNFIRIRIYLNDVQSTIACIKDTRSKYIYIYTWSKLMKELYEVRTI